MDAVLRLLTLLLLLVLATPAWAATPSLIRHRHGDGPNNGNIEGACGPNNKCTIRLPEPSLASNLLVLFLRFDFSSGRTVTITDDQSNTWTKATATGSTGTGSDIWALYVCGAAAGTTELTLNFDAVQLDLSWDVMEFNNVATSSCLDNSSVNASATLATVSSASLTPTSATVSNPDLIVMNGADTAFQGFGSTTAITGFTAGSSFSLAAADRHYATATQWRTVTSNAAFTPSVTISGSNGDSAGAVALAFKSAAAGTALGTGIAIRGIHEQHLDGSLSSYTFSIPTYGNAILLTTSLSGSGIRLSSVSSSPANTWSTGCDSGCTKTIGATSPQFAFTCNASTGTTMTITITTATAGTNFWTIYDIDNADHASSSSCYDKEVDTDTGTHSGDPDVTSAPSITPTNTNGIVFAWVGLGTGPAYPIAPTGVVVDTIDYPYTVTTTGNLHSTTTVDNLASTTGVEVNMSIREPGAGIPDLDYVTVIVSSSNLTMNTAATVTGTGKTIIIGGKTDAGPELGDGWGHLVHTSSAAQSWTWRFRNQQQSSGLAVTAVAIKAAVQVAAGGPPMRMLMGVGQ